MSEAWTPERILGAWGEWCEYGQDRSVTAGRGGEQRAGLEEKLLAHEYVEGRYLPPADCGTWGRVMARARPVLVHRYAKLLPISGFQVRRLPGQSRMDRLIEMGWVDMYWLPDNLAAELVWREFMGYFDRRMKERPLVFCGHV